MGLKDYSADNTPSDPRLQPIVIGNVKVSFTTDGIDWEKFVSSQSRLSASLSFDEASSVVQDTYMEMVKNRCVRAFSTNLPQLSQYYFIEDTRVEKGSVVVTIDLSVLPAELIAILSTSGAILYKTLTDYETMKKNAGLIVKDVTNVLSQIRYFIYTNMPSFLSMNFEQDVANIVIALGVAAIFDEDRDELTKLDENHLQNLAKEDQALRERIRLAEEQGRLAKPDRILIN